jgi:hypothetical protein
MKVRRDQSNLSMKNAFNKGDKYAEKKFTIVCAQFADGVGSEWVLQYFW